MAIQSMLALDVAGQGAIASSMSTKRRVGGVLRSKKEESMRTRGRVVILLAGVIATVLNATVLTACAPSTPTAAPPTASPSASATPTPTPTPTPTWSADQQAAIDRVREYQRVFSGLASGEIADMNQLATVAADVYPQQGEFTYLLADLNFWRGKGWKLVGPTLATNLTPGEPMTQWDRPSVLVVGCYDPTQAVMVDADGTPVPTNTEKTKGPFTWTLSRFEDGPDPTTWYVVATEDKGDVAC